MATLQSGQTISIQLAEGESYTVTPSGTAQVSTRGVSGSMLSAPRTLTSAQTFGPYAESGALNIACLSGSVDYAQFGGALSQDAYGQVWNGSVIVRPWVTDPTPPRFRELRSGRSVVGWSLTNNGGATGAMTLQQTSPFGEPAIRIEIPNDTGSVDVIADDLALNNFTAGTGNLIWHVYVDDELAIKQWQVHLGNDTSLTRNINNTYNLSNAITNRANGHHIGSLNIDNATANTLLTTDQVNRLRLRFFGQPGGGGATRYVWIRGVYLPEDVTPWMVVTVDDSDLSMLTRFHPELRNRGLFGTFAIDWDAVGTNPALFVSQAQLGELYAYGHDIASHNRQNVAYAAVSPPTAQPTDADRLTYCTSFRYVRNVMRELGWNRCLGYHPVVQGGHDGAQVDALKSHGASVMRTTGPGNVVPFRCGLQSVFRQRQLGSGFSLSTARGWVDSAVTRKEDFFLMGHILDTTASSSITWAQTDFAALLDYAISKGVRVGSVSQWAASRGVVV